MRSIAALQDAAQPGHGDGPDNIGAQRRLDRCCLVGHVAAARAFT
jgi:hypothetical protein